MVSSVAHVIFESVFYEGEDGWMVEMRLDGRAISTYGPYAHKSDAELWAMEIGRRAAAFAERTKGSLSQSLEGEPLQ